MPETGEESGGQPGKWDFGMKIPRKRRGPEGTLTVVDGRRMLDRSRIARYEGIGL